MGQQGFGGEFLPETSGPKRGLGGGCRVATGVAGHGQFELSDWSLPLTVLGAHGLHAGSSKGGGPPPPSCGEQRWVHRPEWEEWQEALHGPQSTWAAPCSEELGRKTWRLSIGSDHRSHSCEHPASAACFLVWVLGKDRSRQCPCRLLSSLPLTSPSGHLPGVRHHVAACSSWGLLSLSSACSPSSPRVVPRLLTGLLSLWAASLTSAAPGRSNCSEGPGFILLLSWVLAPLESI